MAGVASAPAFNAAKCWDAASPRMSLNPLSCQETPFLVFQPSRIGRRRKEQSVALHTKVFVLQRGPADFARSGVFFEDVCQGCRRQGLGLGLGFGLGKGLKRGPIAQAVGRQEGRPAGGSGRGASNRASRVDTAGPLVDAPVLAGEESEQLESEVRLPSGSATNATSANGATSVNGASSANGAGTSRSLSNGASIRGGGTEETDRSRSEGGTPTGNTTPQSRPPPAPAGGNPFELPKRLWRKLLRSLSSLELAIGMLLTIAAVSSIGSVIEQNKSYQFYIDNYPEDRPELGFLTWKVLLTLELDHLYTSWWFLSMLVFLAACLMACTSTRQLPMAKVARRWRFLASRAQFRDMDVMEELPRAKAADLVAMLGTQGYQVFSKGPAVYAFKGLAGKLGPIGVHVGLILTMAGCAYSATAGFEGSSMTPQGQEFFIGDVLRPVGLFSRVPAAEQYRVHVNNFTIDYMPNGNVSQFYSDLSIVDLNDKEVYHKMIRVNDPLRYAGVTMYQTDWNLASLQARVDGGAPFRLPMAILDNGEGKTGKLFGTFLRTGPEEEPRGASLVARDFLQVAIYGPDGSFVGVRRPGSNKPIKVDGKDIVIEDVIGATGMQLKYDPGVPFVYAGFGTLIVTVIVSQVSHDQLWALEEGGVLLVGARSTKNKSNLPSDLDFLFNALPEYLPSEEVPSKV